MKCVILFAALLAVTFAQLEDAPVSDAVVPELKSIDEVINSEDVATVEPVPESRAVPAVDPANPEDVPKPFAIRPEGRSFGSLPGYKQFKYFSTTTPSWISRFTSTTAAPTRRPTVLDIVTPAIAKYYDADRTAEIIDYINEVNPDGSYRYRYELSNGVKVEEEGQMVSYNNNESGMVARGSFSWVDKDGKTISTNYIADKNGYQPQSDAIPRSAPEFQRTLPSNVAKSLLA